MKADEILKKHEDANEYHFHEVDRKWIIQAMEEYANYTKAHPPTVPYQRCPVCDGTGSTLAEGCTSGLYQTTCKACDGKMIIAMHIVDLKYDNSVS